MLISILNTFPKFFLLWLALIFFGGCTQLNSDKNSTDSSGSGITENQIFESGNGTPENPFRVKTARQLSFVRNNLKACYLQVSDIDLKKESYDSGSGWLPIGTNDYPFEGVYDGGGYSIMNLYIDRPLGKHNGLFGFFVGAKISNLIIKDVYIRGSYKVGALAGTAFYGTKLERIVVKNAYLKVEERYAGGIVGSADDISIHQCAFEGTIEKGFYDDWNFIGGISGSITSSTTNKGSVISESFANVIINSNIHNSLGGLVGAMWNNAIISDCYSIGEMNVFGDYVGGIAGEIRLGTENKKILNSFTTIEINAKKPIRDVHAFVGHNEGGEVFNSFYFNSQKRNYLKDSLAAELDLNSMKSIMSFTKHGWDFDSVWSIDSTGIINDGFPYLKWFSKYYD